jgi:hypothetical protein
MNKSIGKLTKQEILALKVRQRNLYYSKGKFRLNIFIILFSIAAGLSYMLNLYVAEMKHNVHYFAANNTYDFLKLEMNSSSVFTDEEVIKWSSNAIDDIFDFSYVSYKFHLNKKTNKYFTNAGRASLISALKESGTLTIIEDKSLIMTSDISEFDGKVVDSGVNKKTGRYEWVIDVPAEITYTESELVSYENNVLFKLIVQRDSLLNGKDGLRIRKILITIVK